MKDILFENYSLQKAAYQSIWEKTLSLAERLKEQQIDDVPGLVEAREKIIEEDLKPLIEKEVCYKRELAQAQGANPKDIAFDPKVAQIKKQVNGLLGQILELDRQNQQAMDQQKQRLQKEIRKLNLAKQAQKGYEPAISPDALFFDKKK